MVATLLEGPKGSLHQVISNEWRKTPEWFVVIHTKQLLVYWAFPIVLVTTPAFDYILGRNWVTNDPGRESEQDWDKVDVPHDYGEWSSGKNVETSNQIEYWSEELWWRIFSGIIRLYIMFWRGQVFYVRILSHKVDLRKKLSYVSNCLN